MNVASLENCKRLFEVSGWGDTKNTWKRLTTHETLKWKGRFLADYNNGVWVDVGEESVPAYDARYLLRKLPRELPQGEDPLDNALLSIYAKDAPKGGYYEQEIVHADTPEDALCLLAIKLLEEGVLDWDE